MITSREFDRAIGDWRAPAPTPRFAVYRNNVSAALIAALRVRYPVTEQLVGPEFFAAMAGAFAEADRPASPVLIAYGGGLPDFIAGFAPAASVPYLADVARLESAWWRAYHAADAQPLPASELASVTPESWGDMGFSFHPSVQLVSSAFAIASIWQAHHGGAAMGSFDTATPQRVLLARPEADVAVRTVSPPFRDLLFSLLAGASLAKAVEDTASRHHGFDLAPHFSGLLGLNVITGISPCGN